MSNILRSKGIDHWYDEAKWINHDWPCGEWFSKIYKRLFLIKTLLTKIFNTEKIQLWQKVGILFGMEDTFPWAFIDKVNELGKGEIIAEPVKIDVLEQGADYGYAVIIDRISQDVPFYRAYLKMQHLMVLMLSIILFGGVQMRSSLTMH